jgi:hypothetical protein
VVLGKRLVEKGGEELAALAGADGRRHGKSLPWSGVRAAMAGIPSIPPRSGRTDHLARAAERRVSSSASVLDKSLSMAARLMEPHFCNRLLRRFPLGSRANDRRRAGRPVRAEIIDMVDTPTADNPSEPDSRENPLAGGPGSAARQLKRLFTTEM